MNDVEFSVSIGPSEDGPFENEKVIEELSTDGIVSKNTTTTELQQNFKYRATWKHHNFYAKCSVRNKLTNNITKVSNTKRFSVFFPPKIILPDNLRLETGTNLEINVTIIANPYNEDKESKPIKDSVRNNLFSKLIF